MPRLRPRPLPLPVRAAESTAKGRDSQSPLERLEIERKRWALDSHGQRSTSKRGAGETLGVTKMEWEAVYRDCRGAEIRIPLIEDGAGKMFVETEGGSLAPYTVVLQDKALGLLTHFRTERITETPPMPSSPELDTARAELDERLRRFPSEHLPNFLGRQTSLKKAIDRRDNFTSATLAALARWSDAIDTELEKLAAARRAAIPEPVFTREELRRLFRGVRVGQLFIGNVAIPASAENDWDAEWVAECEGCNFEGNVKASTILKMQVGYLTSHQCGRPCKG
jgi:hypothetical protein